MTPARMRQEFGVYTKPKHLRWSRQGLKGLVYVVTGLGPMKLWLKVIGRVEDRCRCGETQNTAHWIRCGLVGDEKGGKLEECYEDEEWCKAVEEFVRRGDLGGIFSFR